MSTHTEISKTGALSTERDPRWKAVVACNSEADGQFYYAVKTTGIYCLPSCAVRLASPDDVSFYQTRDNAEQAGYRPCKRCKPDSESGSRRRDAGGVLQFAIGESSLGLVLVARSGEGLCAVLFGDDGDALQRDLQSRFPNAVLTSDEGNPAFRALVVRVIELVEAPARGLDVPLHLRGTEFQQAVWQALREIPAGATVTYAQIARRIGRPNAVRGVAQACGANPLAVIVPCHRVLRSDGSLSGYRWGTERKRALLKREAAFAPDTASDAQ